MAIPDQSAPITKWDSGRVSDLWYAFLNGTFYTDLGNSTGTLTSSSVQSNVRALTASATAAAGDVCDVDATAGDVTITLPAASANTGRIITVTKTDATANTVTMSGTINGESSLIITLQYTSIDVKSNGTEWRIV